MIYHYSKPCSWIYCLEIYSVVLVSVTFKPIKIWKWNFIDISLRPFTPLRLKMNLPVHKKLEFLCHDLKISVSCTYRFKTSKSIQRLFGHLYAVLYLELVATYVNKWPPIPNKLLCSFFLLHQSWMIMPTEAYILN